MIINILNIKKMKKLLIIAFTILVFSANAQELKIPVNVTDSTAFRFMPTTLILRQIGGGDFAKKTVNLYFEISDSLQSAPRPYQREFKIQGNIQLPSSALSSCFDANGKPISAVIDLILKSFFLKTDPNKEVIVH